MPGTPLSTVVTVGKNVNLMGTRTCPGLFATFLFHRLIPHQGLEVRHHFTDVVGSVRHRPEEDFTIERVLLYGDRRPSATIGPGTAASVADEYQIPCFDLEFIQDNLEVCAERVFDKLRLLLLDRPFLLLAARRVFPSFRRDVEWAVLHRIAPGSFLLVQFAPLVL